MFSLIFSRNSNSIQNTEVYETMEADDEANCSTDPDGSVHKASVTKKRVVKNEG